MSDTPVRTNISTKADIEVALADTMSALCDWISSQPDEAFERGPADRWTMGQHLEHLVRSVQPFVLALSLPRFVVSLAMPKVTRPGMSYAEVATTYEGVLDAGGKAGGRYVPPAVPLSRKAKLLAKHRTQRDNLVRLIHAFPDAQMDTIGAKHPLIGIMSLRELLYFAVHHEDHHLNTLKRDYAS